MILFIAFFCLFAVPAMLLGLGELIDRSRQR